MARATTRWTSIRFLADLRVMLGDGNNVVKFGGTAKKIDADFLVGQYFAGSGNDKVIFDDSNGDDNTHRDYSITATGFLNQAFNGFESAELKTAEIRISHRAEQHFHDGRTERC